MADDPPTEPIDLSATQPMHVPPLPPPSASFPPPPPPPPPPAAHRRGFDSDSWLARNKVAAIGVAILAVYLVRTNLESRDQPDAGKAQPSSAASSAARSSGADSQSSPDDDGESADFVPRSTAAPTARTSATSAAAAPAPPPPPAKKEDVDFVMPDYTGRGLQSAQNDVQQHGVFFSRSDDLRGSRRQILDRNWKVCSQIPAPGDRVHGSRTDVEGSIEFGVVKTDEDCP